MSDRDPESGIIERLAPRDLPRKSRRDRAAEARAKGGATPLRDQGVRELAEEMSQDLFTMGGLGEAADRLVLTQDDPERKLGGWCRRAVVDRIEAHLSSFLAEHEVPRAAHVITKRRRGGDREEVAHYMVGPRRETAEEAEDDLSRFEGAEELEAEQAGALAALRGALGVVRDAIAPMAENAFGYGEDVMHGPNGETEVVRRWPRRNELVEQIDLALATDAGREEAEVIRAVLENAVQQPEGYWIVRLPDEMMAPLRAARGGKGES